LYGFILECQRNLQLCAVTASSFVHSRVLHHSRNRKPVGNESGTTRNKIMSLISFRSTTKKEQDCSIGSDQKKKKRNHKNEVGETQKQDDRATQILGLPACVVLPSRPSLCATIHDGLLATLAVMRSQHPIVGIFVSPRMTRHSISRITFLLLSIALFEQCCAVCAVIIATPSYRNISIASPILKQQTLLLVSHGLFASVACFAFSRAWMMLIGWNVHVKTAGSSPPPLPQWTDRVFHPERYVRATSMKADFDVAILGRVVQRETGTTEKMRSALRIIRRRRVEWFWLNHCSWQPLQNYMLWPLLIVWMIASISLTALFSTTFNASWLEHYYNVVQVAWVIEIFFWHPIYCFLFFLYRGQQHPKFSKRRYFNWFNQLVQQRQRERDFRASTALTVDPDLDPIDESLAFAIDRSRTLHQRAQQEMLTVLTISAEMQREKIRARTKADEAAQWAAWSAAAATEQAEEYAVEAATTVMNYIAARDSAAAAATANQAAAVAIKALVTCNAKCKALGVRIPRIESVSVTRQKAGRKRRQSLKSSSGSTISGMSDITTSTIKSTMSDITNPSSITRATDNSSMHRSSRRRRSNPRIPSPAEGVHQGGGPRIRNAPRKKTANGSDQGNGNPKGPRVRAAKKIQGAGTITSKKPSTDRNHEMATYNTSRLIV